MVMVGRGGGGGGCRLGETVLGGGEGWRVAPTATPSRHICKEKYTVQAVATFSV